MHYASVFVTVFIFLFFLSPFRPKSMCLSRISSNSDPPYLPFHEPSQPLTGSEAMLCSADANETVQRREITSLINMGCWDRLLRKSISALARDIPYNSKYELRSSNKRKHVSFIIWFWSNESFFDICLLNLRNIKVWKIKVWNCYTVQVFSKHVISF